MSGGEVRRVSEIMTKEVITARPHESVSRIKRVMRDKKIHAIPVLDDFDRLLGILTATDLLGRRPEGERATVGSVMTRRVFVLSPDANLLMLVRLMKRWRLHHVVITEEVGKVIGIVSSYDLLDLVEAEMSHRPPPPQPASSQEQAPKPVRETAPMPARKAPPKRVRETPPMPARKSPPKRAQRPPLAPALPLDPPAPGVECITDDPDASDIGLVFLDSNPDFDNPIM